MHTERVCWRKLSAGAAANFPTCVCFLEREPSLHDYTIWFQCWGSKLQHQGIPPDWDHCLRSGTPLLDWSEKHTDRLGFQSLGRCSGLQGGREWLQMDSQQGSTHSPGGAVLYYVWLHFTVFKWTHIGLRKKEKCFCSFLDLIETVSERVNI